MTPIPNGAFVMGSANTDPDARDDERPAHRVQIEPYWMMTHEVTWDLFDEWASNRAGRRSDASNADTSRDPADGVSRPSPTYVPPDHNMGHRGGYPAISMTQFAAMQFTKWLTMKTGRFHRLPTETEWEYACRAGSTTRYHFGDDPSKLDDYAWHFGNSDDAYHKVGTKKPNAWGLFDMHGNVAEWVLDGYDAKSYAGRASSDTPAASPWLKPTARHPIVARGGSWDDEPADLRSAARKPSGEHWNVSDPNLPHSIWWLRDAPFVGFRIIRPLNPPPRDQWERYWEPYTDELREVYEQQRRNP